MKNDTAIILGNFHCIQIPEELDQKFKEIKRKYAHTIVLSPVNEMRGSKTNFLSIDLRINLLKDYCFNKFIEFKFTPTDDIWSQRIDEIIQSQKTPGFDFFILDDFGHRNYTGKFKYLTLNTNYENTVVEHMDSPAFRAGVLYAYQHLYPKVYPTVDIAVFRNNYSEVLLGQKYINYKWRLPGGFSDPTDKSFKDAAIRELNEECGELKVTNVQHQFSIRMKDWRYEHETDKIITTVHSAEYVSGEVTPMDDIDELEWFDQKTVLTLLETGEITPEHIDLIKGILPLFR